MNSSNRTALLVGAFAQELAHVQQCLPDWRCLIVPLDEKGIEASMIPSGADLVIVYAQIKKVETLAICNHLRRIPETSSVPILLVVNRHAVVQGNVVKRLGNAAFIIPPFSSQEILDRITQCFEMPQETAGRD